MDIFNKAASGKSRRDSRSATTATTAAIDNTDTHHVVSPSVECGRPTK